MSDPVSRLNAALEGRYRIERELGEGGMATVYLAEDLKHDRRVALKLIDTDRPAIHPVLSPDGRWLAYVSDESGNGRSTSPTSPKGSRGSRYRRRRHGSRCGIPVAASSSIDDSGSTP